MDVSDKYFMCDIYEKHINKDVCITLAGNTCIEGVLEQYSNSILHIITKSTLMYSIVNKVDKYMHTYIHTDKVLAISSGE
jgi:small nuclear ribonucleoprotein (snRNP)-like protein